MRSMMKSISTECGSSRSCAEFGFEIYMYNEHRKGMCLSDLVYFLLCWPIIK